ncbi:hypothetical protein HD806DRAFT_511231 [Xylariaceae sp. AK1471]|nr:hypothetical protein HD806DRAFT_511231 [Xylariaceae sp. AK1471]
MSRRAVDTTDKSRTAPILLWFIFVVSVLAVAARLGTKYAMTRKLQWDDYLMLAAQAAYLAECISVTLSASNGLGKPVSELSDATVDSFLKTEYASIIFFIISLTLIKWSISSFIRQLSPSSIHKRLDWINRSVILSWLLSSTLISLFQCALPMPWDYIHGRRCVDRRAWWTYVAVLNIITDLFTVALYVFIIGRLQISLSKKTVVLSIFLTRLLVVGATIAQLTVFLKAFSYSDPTGTLWLPMILNQAILSLSTITACTPYLKPFMESLESGIVRVENIDGSEEELSRNMDGSGFSGSYCLSNTRHSSVAYPSHATT